MRLCVEKPHPQSFYHLHGFSTNKTPTRSPPQGLSRPSRHHRACTYHPPIEFPRTHTGAPPSLFSRAGLLLRFLPLFFGHASTREKLHRPSGQPVKRQNPDYASAHLVENRKAIWCHRQSSPSTNLNHRVPHLPSTLDPSAETRCPHCQPGAPTSRWR